MKFQELKKNLKKDFTGLKTIKVALLGDSATQFIAMAIKASGYDAGLNINLYEVDYDLVYETLIDQDHKIYTEKYDYIILFHSSEKLLQSFYKTSSDRQKNFFEDRSVYFETITNLIKKNSSAGIILNNFNEINDGVFGNYSSKTASSFIHQQRKINIALQDLAASTKNIFIADLLSLVNIAGSKNVTSAKWYLTSQNSFILDFLPEVAKSYTDILAALSGKIKKCLIMDLDNTLWGGIIGDDGIENIQIGDLGIGKAFTGLQYWAKELKKRGILLAVCSKNDEIIAKTVFENHPDMVLRLDDISIFVANWSNKGDNIKFIQEVLNIGMDSLVFIDDNPFERNLVKSMHPQVCVPDLPEDPANYVSYLQSLNLFETASFTEEDTIRTKQYKEESERVVLQQSFESVDEYLRSLQMVATVEEINAYNVGRCAQLTQRSNQFNLTTIRYTEQQLTTFINDGGKAICVSLKDKFGDYGLISLVLLEPIDDAVKINTWIMSCRVLKRGVEEFAVNEMVNAALKLNTTRLNGIYIPTPKNCMVKDIYINMGFTESDAGSASLHLAGFTYFKTFIQKDSHGK